MKTMQEYFNLMVAGLASQGFQRSARPLLDAFGKQIGDQVNCLFRGPNGLKCAVGHLISDEAFAELRKQPASNYIPEPEPSTTAVLAVAMGLSKEADVYLKENEPTRAFLVRAQTAHDNSKTPEEMKGKLVRLAHQNHLTVPPELEGVEHYLYEGETEEQFQRTIGLKK